MKTLKSFKKFTEKYTDYLRDTVLKLESNRRGHCDGDEGGGHCSGLKEEDEELEEDELKLETMNNDKIEIVGYPEGNSIIVTTKQFDALNKFDLISYDEEEEPQGQWIFDNEYEDEVERIIAKN